MLSFTRTKPALFMTAGVLAALAGTTVAAAAQPSQDAASSMTLGEVVVTAQKRAENVQNVPATITALSAETLANRQITNITDLKSQVPSMEVGQLYGANLITLRGISTGLTSGTEDPSVAVHVNGVYQPRSRSLDVALMDLDRVEVLSGPQGTLYGRNATGGVVNYITKRPTAAYHGELTGLIANYDRYAVRASVSGPITSELGFRLSGMYDDQHKGFTKNLLPGAPDSTLENRKVRGAHLTLEYRPTDALQLDLDGMYVKSDTRPLFAAFAASGVPAFQTLFAPQTFRPHEVYTALAAGLPSDQGQVSLTATWKVSDNVELKSISAYQNYIDHMSIDLDSSAYDAVSVNQPNKSYTYTQEIDLTSHTFSDRLTSVFGFFYFNDHYKNTSVSDFGVISPPTINQFIFTAAQKSKSYAFFTDQTLKVTDRLRLIAGIRYNKDEKSAVQTGAFAGVGPLCPTFRDTADWSSWTPRFGAQYDVGDHVMIYAQWQKGFKAGGFVANSCGNPYNPEKIHGPEVGLKSELFDRRLRLNAAAYYYDYTDLQVEKVVGVGTFLVQNAASAVLKGIEVSSQFIATDRLRFDAAANVQSATYTNFTSCNQSAFPGACSAADPRPPAAQIIDLSGRWLNRAPPYSVNVGAEYRFDMPGGGNLLVRGESYWSGRVHFDEFASPLMTQKPYSIQNAFVTYTPPNDRFQIRAFVKNIGDTNYKVSGFYVSGAEEFTGNWAPPRTFGGEVTVKF